MNYSMNLKNCFFLLINVIGESIAVQEIIDQKCLNLDEVGEGKKTAETTGMKRRMKEERYPGSGEGS